jgi:hypothetical protein
MHTITIGACACGKRGTLINGMCGFCDDASNGHLARPKPAAPMTVTRALDLLVAELEADEISAPLHQRLTLAAIAADLCRLAGEPVPAAVLDALDGPTCAPLAQRETHREPAYAAD